MTKWGFYIDSNSCSGCKTCQVACQDKNNLEPGHLWRRVYEIESGTWKREGEAWTVLPASWFVSVSCNHCSDPQCVSACPTGAMNINSHGVVVVNQKVCMGCAYCSWACPYDAPRIDRKSGKMSKCDFCFDRIITGNNPVCVDACPMRALDFGPMDELEKKYGSVKSVYPLPDHEITEPSIVIKPHHNSFTINQDNTRISNIEEVTDG